MSPVPAGWRAFARYAHGPNALGYCGPPARSGLPGLVEVALGVPEGEQVDVPQLARSFSGAWPYQQILAGLSEVEDPLSPSVVRSYWTGGELTRRVDRTAFGAALLDHIAPLAGHYWTHLSPDLLVEAAPTHIFHVVGVYPWSRLLATGLPEPLQVIDSCRITPARVIAVEGDQLRVASRGLRFDAGAGLSLAAEAESQVSWLVDGQPFADGIEVGVDVAVHWGFACDVLTPHERAELEWWTDWQLEASRPRLSRAD